MTKTAHRNKAIKPNYSPDQDRADNGEFGDGAGGGSSDKGSSGGKSGAALDAQLHSDLSKVNDKLSETFPRQGAVNGGIFTTIGETGFQTDIGSKKFLGTPSKSGYLFQEAKFSDSKGAQVKEGGKSFEIKLHTAQDCDCGCDNACHDMKMWKSNLSGSDLQYKKKGKNTYLVVPVIMAKAGVVMNGSLTEENELMPMGWNGRPVTLGHPTDNQGDFLSANATPDTDQKWQIGTLYNSSLDDDGTLRSEAWIDVQKANALDATLIARLKKGDKIDVSTGYFCDEEHSSGVSNGREYTTIARNLIPDHLAILTNEEGACNWADGCGVRANKRRLRMKSKTDKALGALLKVCGVKAKSPEAEKIAGVLAELIPNARGADDDSRQMCADLISNDESPFTPDDETSLHMMSPDALAAVRDKFIGKPDPAAAKNAKGDDGADEEDEEDPTANTDGDEPDDDDQTTDQPDGKKSKKAKKDNEMSKKEIEAVVNAAVTAALASAITPEDRLAINTAKDITSKAKADLVEKITKNSAMVKAEVEKLDLATLQLIANGLRMPDADYSGRATPRFNEQDDEAAGMVAPSIGEVIRNARKATEKGASH